MATKHVANTLQVKYKILIIPHQYIDKYYLSHIMLENDLNTNSVITSKVQLLTHI